MTQIPDLAELREVAEAATPGPWESRQNDDMPGKYVVGPRYKFGDVSKGPMTLMQPIFWDQGSADNAEFIATFDPPTVLALLSRLEQAEQDRDSSREACKTLAEVLSNHSEWIVKATDSQDLIGEDGDGDWDVVWDRVMELGEDKRKAEQAVARVREVVANLEDHSRPRTAHKFAVAEKLRRALDGDTRG